MVVSGKYTVGHKIQRLKVVASNNLALPDLDLSFFLIKKMLGNSALIFSQLLIGTLLTFDKLQTFVSSTFFLSSSIFRRSII